MLYSYYREKVKFLKSAGVDDARLDAKILICHALSLSDGEFFMQRERTLTDAEKGRIDALINRRADGEPVQYIIGRWSFMRHEFIVNEGCLIPRQDTETLVESAIKIIRENKYKTLLDLCTGSGCIGISLAIETGINTLLSDISEAALSVARQNAALNNAKVSFIKSDMFKSIRDESGKKPMFDVITVNPPYLTRQDMEELQKEVRFEPENALFGGDDGLLFYRIIASEYKSFLNENGTLLMEIGMRQEADIKALFPECTVLKDICQKPRVAVVKRV